ncbi:hypothetical protein AYO49_03420 [Verrucomicrobiaceae bacterium SCGC AG-212-N21]|nr:hypothetical protein AYO49_03420 [Verrucomicrobiaceae bacterium SCGC AG-212-N21]
MTTTITIRHAPDRSMSGTVAFEDGASLELFPGMLQQVVAQVQAALLMGPGKHGAIVQGTPFATWGHALLKKAAELDTPRYNIDEILQPGRNFAYELGSRLRFFLIERLHIEERVFVAASSFNIQMGAGILWLMDNGYAEWIGEARKAFKIMGAVPYVTLLDDLISRLKFRGIDVFSPDAYDKWNNQQGRMERNFQSAFKLFDQRWWNYWEDERTQFDTYARRYVLAKIDVFRSRSGEGGAVTE